jgi:hypothetical protein
MNRRFFLQSAAATAVAPLFCDGAPGSGSAQTGAESWVDRPMRWAQLTLVENDPGRYDPAFWLDYFHRTHSDAACLSAGGVVAYYPTKVPLHHRSRWMGNTDPFGELNAGCRKLGMNVVARTDPHAAHQDVYEAHPDWIAVDESGKKRRHWAAPALWVTCGLGPYNFEFMTAVTREIVERYQVDGVFSNRWSGSGMCYCEHCQANFAKATGFELPRTSNPQDPTRRAYIVWRQERLFELWKVWDDAIRKANPRACFIANAGGGALSPLDMKTIGELAPTLFADRQARHGVSPPWTNGKNGKEYRATLGRKPIVGIFSVGIEEAYRWKDSVQTPEEIRLWVADGVANGLRPWFTKFSGVVYDHRWLKPVVDFYEWHYRNEAYLRNERPLARVGIVYSQQTATFYGGDQAQAKVEDHTLGFYQALVEARIPFEMVHDHLLDETHTAPFRTLILPNIAALSTAQCGGLRRFVERGGSLIATYETSLYDELGVRLEDFGLSDIFGASAAGKAEGPLRNSYLNIEKDSRTGAFHPLLKGLEDAGRIINGVHRIPTRPHDKNEYSPLTLVPSYPDLPMEEVYPRIARTDVPEVYVRQVGKGRVVYFPWDIDRVYWEILTADHGALLRNAVLWATDEEPLLTVQGTGMLDVAMWEQKRSMTVCLVNLTNPMMMKGPVREVITLGAQSLRIRVPEDRRVSGVKLLVAGTRPRYSEKDGAIALELPTIGLHEVVALDFV